ncbi:VacJ family lipoprotein [bacterium]|nr:MAG: VacJ family lipoprotein [bacterium]
MHHWFRESLYISTFLFSIGICGFSDVGWVSAEEENTVVSMSQPEALRLPSDNKESDATGITAAYFLDEAESTAAREESDQDPWEPFNETMFSFNRNVVDRFMLKPVAVVWDTLLPDPVQRSLRNALDNLSVVRRLVNNILQLKMEGTGREVARFTINSTIGVAGLFDVAKDGFGILQSDEDTGQTMGVYGMGPGPYMILPFLPPMTVRDGIGLAADGAMNPLNYFIPFAATAGIYGTNAINERSLNLDKFERVEETVVDLYSAVRNAYLQRRAAAIKE